jgi:hypothetical protein
MHCCNFDCAPIAQYLCVYLRSATAAMARPKLTTPTHCWCKKYLLDYYTTRELLLILLLKSFMCTARLHYATYKLMLCSPPVLSSTAVVYAAATIQSVNLIPCLCAPCCHQCAHYCCYWSLLLLLFVTATTDAHCQQLCYRALACSITITSSSLQQHCSSTTISARKRQHKAINSLPSKPFSRHIPCCCILRACLLVTTALPVMLLALSTAVVDH